MLKEKLIERALKLYAGDHVVNRVLELGEEALRLNGVPQKLTMMFIQTVPNYSLGKENFISDLNSSLLNLIISSVSGNDGVVDSFIGTDVFAFWGLDGKPGHEKRAARCALRAQPVALLSASPRNVYLFTLGCSLIRERVNAPGPSSSRRPLDSGYQIC